MSFSSTLADTSATALVLQQQLLTLQQQHLLEVEEKQKEIATLSAQLQLMNKELKGAHSALVSASAMALSMKSSMERWMGTAFWANLHGKADTMWPAGRAQIASLLQHAVAVSEGGDKCVFRGPRQVEVPGLSTVFRHRLVWGTAVWDPLRQFSVGKIPCKKCQGNLGGDSWCAPHVVHSISGPLILSSPSEK